MSTLAWTTFRQGIGYQGLLLGCTVALAATLLVVADRLTREPIALRHAEDMNASLAQVIPPERHDNDLLANTLTLTDAAGTPVTIYRALLGGQVTAVAFQVTGQGYAGEIGVMLGLAVDGKVLGARVLSHKETPGLGDKIEVAKDDWILAFTGLSLGDPSSERWAVKKDGGDFDQFSGATITPRAVVRALKGGLEFFAANRGAMTASAAPDAAARTLTTDH
ncbi:electron transport complex subunit RsxG [Thiocystis violacea]|uniref:electron transport complex subunit RsxG n=1 Tax=Thiocystis violacea TaxID=13725 RepID=UPI001905D119|nr:electron transport complex subunit RsxG [Thiocystis violacea]MBK1718905.1 electron transport complex subunit RsxG [Thiocystis violacea]